MIDPRFEEALDQLLHEDRSLSSLHDLAKRLPGDFRGRMENDAALRNDAADRLHLHRLIAGSPRPEPSAGFSERVIAHLPRPTKAESRRPWAAYAGWSMAVAAGLGFLLVVGGLGELTHKSASVETAPPKKNEAAPPSAPAPLVVDASKELEALWQELADPLTPSGAPTPERLLACMELPSPKIGVTFRHSGARLAEAGKSFGDQIRPLSASVGGAFGFLLDLPTSVEKRSL